ncbi:ferrous iron transport protein B [Anaerovibrio sp.]|uniref:ferrous iron transport protein B n=1 Tax=Anaerovibrio sp. TaxID=1872532 RepID=UPI0025F0F897|nr:ferrous iron transport protein B [Anaerovibrio sp.]
MAEMTLHENMMSVALTGNPNTGKSTIFNEITGARQKIGNWPGVTVDKKEGHVTHEGRHIHIIDLPGTYSINARSPEEKIVIDFLMENKMDLVVDVIDSSNIERNLFLTVQLLEKGIPLLLDLNMQDEAVRRGIKIDVKKLEAALGFPVLLTTGRDGKSIKNLLNVVTSIAMDGYGPSERLQAHIAKVKEIEASGLTGSDLQEAIIKQRYAFIDSVLKETVEFTRPGATFSEKADKILANGVLALPMFLVILYAVFQIVFEWIGQPIADALDEFIGGTLTDTVSESLASLEVADWMQSLIVDGIIGGVGSVLTFVPLIFMLFFCLSFLDGTGYMARVAFIMDPIMRRAGLTGKGVLPLMMSFGCSVPSIMGARALDSEKDRKLAILAAPFLTCGAKLPIMALFAAMFFPDNAANIVFLMYIIGVVMAIVSTKFLSATKYKDETATFLLELPPYRMPDMKTVLLETWDKGKGYLVKAGTIIFAGCVLIWFLGAFNSSGMVEDQSESFLASIGAVVGTLFTFHGFGNWEAGASVISGILAKESVISTIGVLYGLPDISAEAEDAVETAEALGTTGMAAAFTGLSAFAFMVFSQLYTPCVTALGTIKKEANSWKMMFFAAGYMFAVAWIISLIVYQVGRLLGFE